MKKSPVVLAVLAVFSIFTVLVLFSGPANAVADLNFKVTDEGQPLAGATLTLTLPDGETITSEDENGDGVFNLSLGQPGDYYVAIIPPKPAVENSGSINLGPIDLVSRVTRVVTTYDPETLLEKEFTETVTSETPGGEGGEEIDLEIRRERTDIEYYGPDSPYQGLLKSYRETIEENGEETLTIVSDIEYYESGQAFSGLKKGFRLQEEAGSGDFTISEIEYDQGNLVIGFLVEEANDKIKVSGIEYNEANQVMDEESRTIVSDIEYYEPGHAFSGQIKSFKFEQLDWPEDITKFEIEYGNDSRLTYKIGWYGRGTARIGSNKANRAKGFDKTTQEPSKVSEKIEKTETQSRYGENNQEIEKTEVITKEYESPEQPRLFSLNIPEEGQLDVSYDWAFDPSPKIYLNGTNIALIEAAQPIEVGPKKEVGTESVGKKLGKSLMGGLLGGGGRRSSSSSAGPKTQKDPARKQDEFEISDEANDIECEIKTLWTEDGLLFSTEIDDHPDKGTFQTVYLLDEYGNQLPPSKIEIYKIWAKHTLTVSWTRSTYQDGNLISQESGGWSESWTEDLGTFKRRTSADGFSGIPPIWALAGYDRAHAGVRQAGTYFQLTPEQFENAKRLYLVIHLTQPKADPVMTTPLIVELIPGPDGAVGMSPVRF